MIDSAMVEAYQLDTAYNTYDVSLDDPVTQNQIDECDGFDDYKLYINAKLNAPRQPLNPAYMKGWFKHEQDFWKYDSWEGFCK